MNFSLRLGFGLPARLPALIALHGLLFAASPARADVLLDCPAGGGGGYWNTRGFYVTNYPGITLDSATMQFAAYSSYSGFYELYLTIRSNTFDGPVLGASVAFPTVSSYPAWTSVTFSFSSVSIPKGSRVCFEVDVLFGPFSQLYFSAGNGCPSATLTVDTTPPLSSDLATGVVLNLTGSQGTVTPGWSIQAAINAAMPGETVFVGPGTYHEDLSMRSGISVIGSGYGSTFLNGTGTTNVVTFWNVTNSRLAGFQITGSGPHAYHAGVLLWGGNPMVDNNLILGNTNGVWIVALSSPIVRNNIIRGNGVPNLGSTYGIVSDLASPLIADNLLVSNVDIGIYLGRPASSPAQAINNTIVGSPYGVYCYNGANPVIKNNIIALGGVGLWAAGGTAPAVSFNDVWGGSSSDYQGVAPGLGGLSVDPRFDPTLPGSYYLAAGSPCIHAGDPDPAYNNADGTRDTMGAYGGPTGLQQSFSTGITTGFLFNSVGIIPTSEITQTGASAGLANVSGGVASALHLEAYEDAPFGGWVWLNGLFGSSDTAVQYYQILGAPWSGSTPPNLTNFTPILDPLTKIKYVIDTNGMVTSTPVNVGPDVNGLYMRTDLPNSGYWAFPDLKLILNTGRLANGKWDFICNAYTSDSLAASVTLASNQLSRITLWIDNNPVTTAITDVRGPSGSLIPECGIIYAVTSHDNFLFDITAYHPTGFLHSFWLSSLYGRNRSGGYVANEQYTGHHDSARPVWYGLGGGSQTNAAGAFAAGILTNWQTCAYQFHLEAWARTINGFGRIYGSSFDDHYYINLGGTPGACVADLNNDGRVDGLDLAIFASRFGTNCSGPPASLSLPLAVPAAKP